MSGCQESLMSEDAPDAKAIISTVKEKRCPKCGEIKPVNFFCKKSVPKDGLNPWCRACSREVSRRWKKKNSKKNRATIKRWEKANPEKMYESAKRWREKNTEKVREKNRRANIKRRSSIRGRLNNNISNSIRGSLHINKKSNHWENLVGYTTEQLKKHLEKQFKTGMSWERFMKGEIHIDHKIPISAFNFEKPEDEDFKKCWSLNNLQPLWALDNIKKSNKLDRHFQPSLIF